MYERHHVDFGFSKDILFTFRMFSIFGFFCGLHKLSISNNKIILIGTKYKIYSTIFGIFMLSGMGSIVYTSFWLFVNYPTSLFLINYILYNVLWISYIILKISSIFIIPKNIQNICYKFLEVDQIIAVYDKNDAKRLYLKFAIFTMCYFAYKIIQIFADFWTWITSNYYLIVHVILIFFDLENFFCISGLNAVARRFEKLNYHMKKSKYYKGTNIRVHNSIWIKMWKINYNEFKHISSKECMLEEYFFIYGKLVDIVDIINNCYKRMVRMFMIYKIK